MPNPNFEDLVKQLSDLLKDRLKDLWDEEDKDFLEWASKDLARIRLKYLVGTYSKEELDTEAMYTDGAVKLKVAQKKMKIKSGLEDIFTRVLGMLAKVAVSVQ